MGLVLAKTAQTGWLLTLQLPLPKLAREGTELFEMREAAVEFSAFEQRFRWDAAPIQTNAAQMASFCDGSLQAQLRRSDCGYISPGPSIDHNQIGSNIH